MNLPLDFVLSNFADKSLRNVADQDYVAARLHYRHELLLPCLWSAEQAIEKYLKAILLYNRRDTNKIGHDIRKALTKVLAIKELEFTIPAHTVDFVNYIDDQGVNRYFTTIYRFSERFLLDLDRAVWHIRKYCMNFRYPAGDFDSPVSDEEFRNRLQDISSPNLEKNACAFRIREGFLERLVDDRPGASRAARAALVWKNFYYGKRRKNSIKNFRMTTAVGAPTHFSFEETYDTLRRYVHFERGVEQKLKTYQATI